MDPFGGNQQIAINSPGCSSGLWRLDQCLLMLHYDLRAVAHYDRTQYPDQNGHWAYEYEGQHYWLRGKCKFMQMHALPAQRISKFPSKFGS